MRDKYEGVAVFCIVAIVAVAIAEWLGWLPGGVQ